MPDITPDTLVTWVLIIMALFILFTRLKAIQTASEESAFYLRKMAGARGVKPPRPGEAQAGFRDKRTRGR